MSNSIAAGLEIDIVVDSAMQAFKDVLLPVTGFSTDFSPAIVGKKGSAVSVPLISADAAHDFANDYTSNGGGAATEVAVALENHKYVPCYLTDTQMHETPMRLEMFGAQQGAALGKAVLQDILEVVTNSNYSTAAFTGASSTFDADDVVDIKDACDDGDMPDSPRMLALSWAYYNQLLKDAAVQPSSAFGGTDPIQGGTVPRLFGFDVYGSGAIPDNSENLVGFAAHPAAMAVAMRYLSPQEGHNYIQARPVVDPDTGLVFGIRQWYDNGTGYMYMVFECVWGKAKAVAGGLKRIVSA